MHRMKQFQEQQKHRWQDLLNSLLLWFTPGLHVKRWLLLILAGTTLLGVGLAYILLDIYRQLPGTTAGDLLANITLIFLPRWLRATIFAGAGVGLVLGGIWGLNRSLLMPFLRPGKPLVESLMKYHRRGRGPNVVTVGGGHGLATLLRGLKIHTSNLTAVVTVADDGGSSGRLRSSMGILPPGDIRNCLAALSEDEELLTLLFKYRFSAQSNELEGHSFGNLFISALSELTGSFEEAVAESGRVLGVSGQVLPATLRDVKLVADKSLPHAQGEIRVRGESRIPLVRGKVRRVWLEPNNPPAFPAAIRALLQADIIVIGPGSLYTSILPNLLVPDIAAAIRHSPALKIFICNVTTQPGETDDYACDDHIKALEEHAGSGLFDLVIANTDTAKEIDANLDWVLADPENSNYHIYQTQLASESEPGKHDAEKLAQVIIDLWRERTGPLVA